LEADFKEKLNSEKENAVILRGESDLAYEETSSFRITAREKTEAALFAKKEADKAEKAMRIHLNLES